MEDEYKKHDSASPEPPPWPPSIPPPPPLSQQIFEAIGSRRFWLVAAAIALTALAVVFLKYRRLTKADAVIPVVTLTGPSEGLPGEVARYGVLVRDQFGAPIPDAPVRLGFRRYGFTQMGHGTTGPGGEVSISLQFPDDFEEERILLAGADVGAAEGFDALNVTPRSPGLGSVFVSTDKPLYQPGQTIHIRGLAMADDKPIAQRPATIEVRAADDTKVFHTEKSTSEFGVISADFVLADQVKLGNYRISVSTSVLGRKPKKTDASQSGAIDPNAKFEIKTTGERYVEVKRYSLPKLKLAFEDLSLLHTDESFTGKVRATWMFGEPVTNAGVVISLAGRQNSGRLDQDGTFQFSLAPTGTRTPKDQQRGTFPLWARLTLEDGTTKELTTSVTTQERSAIKLEAFPEGGALVAGHAQTVYVVASEGPIPGLLVRPEAANEGVKTSERGIAKLTVTPPLPVKDEGLGDLREPVPRDSRGLKPFKIVAFDEQGGEGSIDVDVKSDTLIVRPDRDAYDAGKTARITVLGANTGDRVSLRMTKGAEPVALGTCTVADGKVGCDATLEIPKGLSGLVWVHALSLPGDKRPVKSGKRLALVGGGSRDLKLALTPDRPSYAPREKGVVDVAVTGEGGSPVKAQLGVTIADEAVFELAQVRPDLEKIFFTIDQDLAKTRGSSRPQYRYASSEGRPPERFEANAAYAPTTTDDVRAVILLALSKMPAIGAAPGSSSDELWQRSRTTIADEKEKIVGWLELVLAVFALIAFACFGVYGVARFRGPELEGISAEDGETFRIESRALYIDWLVAILAPPLLGGAGSVVGEIAGSRGLQSQAVVGTWFVLALFCTAFLLVRAVLRVRRTAVSKTAAQLRGALVFLPVAAFFSHMTIILIVNDQGRKLGTLFDVPKDAFFVPLAVVIALQLACGLLSVIRATSLGPVTRKRRIWLLLSRASFLGLPLSLVAGVLFVRTHIKTARVSWEEYAMDERTTETFAENSDNKEGGTGTRAKGEEGSMRAPGQHAAMGVAREAAKMEPMRRGMVRDQFPETLLWAPEVITDESGHAKISVPFADAITTYRFGVNAVSRAGQLGSATLPLSVKQDFFVDATMPPTLTQGDEIALPVTVFSYQPAAQEIQLLVEGDGFSAVGKSTATLHLEPRQSRGSRFVVRADKAGARTVRVRAVGPTHEDTLERKILVIPNGLELTKVTNGRVVGSSSTKATLPKNAIDGGNDLYIKIYGGPLSQVSEGLDGVFQMPHGCFEQTSSVTYPSILALDFLRRTKTVRPEVERRAREYIAQGVQRLLSFEVGSSGGYSLFGSAPASTTLTAYGLMEFADLSRVGDIDPAVLQRTQSWLYGRRTATGGWTRTESKDAKEQRDDVLTTAYVAWALATLNDSRLPKETGTTPAADEKLKSVLDVVARATGPDADEPYALVLRANALIAGRRSADAKPLLDRLAGLAVRDEQGVHWTSKSVGVMHSYGDSMAIEVTGLASHALALAERDPELRNGALDWLVARRNANGTWSTTQATIAAMRALLDEARPTPTEVQDVTILVDNAPAETVRLDPEGRAVHHLASLRKWATTGDHVVEVKAGGAADISYQLVAKHYVPWQKTAGPSPLSLDVSYGSTTVQAGSVVTARVRLAWNFDSPARMPIVEIAIPPAFEVDSADLDKLVGRDDSRVSRYTLERGQLTLYLVELPRSSPLVVDLPMRALRRAKVLASASDAYLYYEPEVRAQTAPVVLTAQ